jgi:hypothetical protein
LPSARLIAGSGPAFNARNVTVTGTARLDQGFAATGTGETGAVCLTGASITCGLSLRGASLANRSGPALAADLITVRSGVAIDRDFRAIGSGHRAAVRLAQATVGGDLLLDGATLANRSGPALAADLISVTGRRPLQRGWCGRPGHGSAPSRPHRRPPVAERCGRDQLQWPGPGRPSGHDRPRTCPGFHRPAACWPLNPVDGTGEVTRYLPGARVF